jgi:uncharacterized phage protein gp47/JayE
MAGLTSSGFIPETYDDIKARIEGKLELLNPGFDFSAESPDGQLLEIMTYEIFQAWSQLGIVYDSYNPAISSGAALRNIGLLTGLPFGVATKSYVTLETQGITGTVIPALSVVADDAGNEYYTAYEVSIPSNIQAVAKISGVLDVSVGTVTNIVTPVAGWDAVTQTTVGVAGTTEQTQQEYRNTRQSTVMRGTTSVADNMQAELYELGIAQAFVVNNDTDTVFADGTPANTIQVKVGEIDSTVSDEDIANAIMQTKSMGCATYGTTSVNLVDGQNVAHTINFTKASVNNVEIALDITFLDDDNAGAEESIQAALVAYINSLPAGEDVIWSRLFAYVTPYGEAQINSLTLGALNGSLTATNYAIGDTEYANITTADITITVV